MNTIFLFLCVIFFTETKSSIPYICVNYISRPRECQPSNIPIAIYASDTYILITPIIVPSDECVLYYPKNKNCDHVTLSCECVKWSAETQFEMYDSRLLLVDTSIPTQLIRFTLEITSDQTIPPSYDLLLIQAYAYSSAWSDTPSFDLFYKEATTKLCQMSHRKYQISPTCTEQLNITFIKLPGNIGDNETKKSISWLILGLVIGICLIIISIYYITTR